MRTARVSFIMLIMLSCVVSAQQQKSFREEFLEETVREHMSVRPLSAEQRAEMREAAARSQASRRADAERRSASDADWVESVVSDDLYPESEVHAVVNPADPANFVVSPIRQQVWNGQITGLDCPLYYTKDNGATWSVSPFQTTSSDPTSMPIGGGDPVLAAASDGTLYFTWLGFYMPATLDRMISELYWSYSSDGGANWVRPERDVIAREDMPFGSSVQHFVDKQWIAVDRSGTATDGTLYVAFLRVSGNRMHIIVRRKLPASMRFVEEDVQLTQDDSAMVQFASIDVDPSGGVHVTWFGSADEQHFSLWHALSTDSGATFPSVTKISDIVFPKFSIEDRAGEIAGMSYNRIYPCPQLAVDRGAHPGHVYMTWTASGITSKENNGTDIYFSRSTDNGLSWETPRIVNDDIRGIRRDQFHPSIAVNGQGVVAVTWYDRREDESNESARYYIAVSRDGGGSFLPNRPVAAMQMDMYEAKKVNGEFGIGEYTQLILTETEAIPFWSDGRTNDGNIDVYSARLGLSTLELKEMAPLSSEFRILNVFPSPANDRLQLQVALDRGMGTRLFICDLLGRVLHEESGRFTAGTHDLAIDVSALAPGSYQAVLQTSAGTASRLIQIVR
jgi:hypothetical protein